MGAITFFVWDDVLDYQLLLATHLKDAGVEVTMIVQTNEGAQRCSQHRLNFVIAEQVYSFFTIRERIEHWWKGVATSNLEHVHYRGYQLWDICRYERTVTASENDVQSLTRSLVRAAEAIEFFYHIVGYLKPDVLLVWNGLCLPTSAFVEVAKQEGIEVYYQERGFFPNTVVVDRCGVNFASYPSRSWQAVENTLQMGSTQEKETMAYITTLHSLGQSVTGPHHYGNGRALREQLRIPKEMKTVLYVAQIDTDTNIVLYTPHYRSNGALIQKLNYIVSRYRNVSLLVKLHPEDTDRREEFEHCLSANAMVVGNSGIHPLLQLSDIVVVRNSTVGLEALTYGKPVVVLGKALYSHKGFTYDVATDEELEHMLKYLITHDHDSVALQKRVTPFLFYLLSGYLYFIDGKEVFEGSNRRIEEAIVETVRGMKKEMLSLSGEKDTFTTSVAHYLKKRVIHNRGKEMSTYQTPTILLIIYNTHLPVNMVLHRLLSASQQGGELTIIGNEAIEKSDIPHARFARFTPGTLIRVLFKRYDLVIFTAADCMKLRVWCYLVLVRAKKKILLDPFNLTTFLSSTLW